MGGFSEEATVSTSLTSLIFSVTGGEGGVGTAVAVVSVVVAVLVCGAVVPNSLGKNVSGSKLKSRQIVRTIAFSSSSKSPSAKPIAQQTRTNKRAAS